MPTVVLSGTFSEVLRADMLQENLVSYPVPWAHLRVFDAFGTNLPAAAGTDDLGLTCAASGTGSPIVKSLTSSGTTVAEYCRFEFVMPPEYIAGTGRVYVRLYSRVEVVANVSATIDVNAYESNEEGGISADLCITGATTINSVTWANRDFILTPTGLEPGSHLDIKISVALDDTGAANACIANIGSIEILCDIKG